MTSSSENAPTNGNDHEKDRGLLLLALVTELTHAHYKLRAIGHQEGMMTASGGSLVALLRQLAEAPKTVPQLARMRPMARQNMQKIVNEMAEAGLVRFEDNPAHKRSKLVALTDSGREMYKDTAARYTAFAEDLSRELVDADLDAAVRTLKALNQALSLRLTE